GVEALAAGGGRAQAARVELEESAVDEPHEPRAVECRLQCHAAGLEEALAVNPFREAQAHHQHLLAALFGAERELLARRVAVALDALEPGLGCAVLARGPLH